MLQVLILCPLYNDEVAFNRFAATVEEVTKNVNSYQFRYLVVNDGSLAKPSLQTNYPATVIHLHRNLGHQKAIAIGLSWACSQANFDAVMVMDADGEDKPEDIPALLAHFQQQQQIVFAKRASRQSSRRFKLFYWMYRLLFRLLTGRQISFGNFVILSRATACRLVHTSEIWNHLAGSIIKSGLPYTTLPLHRGQRYAGASKMKFTTLALHGLGAIGVFVEIIATRLLIFSLAMIALSVTAIAAIVAIRLFTQAAIPGWATSAFSAMLIVLLQSFLLSLFTIFLYLSAQSQRQFIPAQHYEDYTASIEEQ